MFLGLKEMSYAKLRYGLIIGIMFLISFVVFMLSGLATGLGNGFKQVVLDWQTDEIVLSDQANKNLAASQLSKKDLSELKASDVSPIGYYPGAIGSGDTQTNVSLFGTEKNAFMLPDLTTGKQAENLNEVIVSQQLVDDGYQVGDTFKIGNYEEALKIVGTFKATTFTVSPVIYTTLATWQKIKYGDQPSQAGSEDFISAALVKGRDKKITNENLEVVTSAEFINSIPGYSAQNLTLTAMIYFLFVIATAVIGIFMYVITLQKTANFGVMKAQGIPNSFIAKGIIAQSFVVGLIGTGVGALTVYGLSFVLPKAMPFAIDIFQWSLYAVVLIFVSILGGLFSINSVRKVDPITAIGG